MSMNGLEAFDNTLQKTHIWINEVAKEMNLDDKRKAFQGLRATLHVLRDRLTPGEAANLGAQLPILLAGFYYENWKPEATPKKSRSKQAFLDDLRHHLHGYFQKDAETMDVEQLARSVFLTISKNITAGELDDVIGILPAELQEFWRQEASV